MANDAVRGHLDLLLLSILSDGPAHGYGVINALRERSRGVLDLAEGTVYPALHKLEGGGLIASHWDTNTGRRRRRYELTPDGLRALAGERARWQLFSGGVQSVVGWAR